MSFKNEEKWVPGELTQKGENNRRLRFSMYSSVRDRPVSLRLSAYSAVRDRQVSITLRSTLYARYEDLREIVLLVDVQSNGFIRTYLFRQ